MYDDQEASLLRNLENRRARLVGAVGAMVEALECGVEQLTVAYQNSEMTQKGFIATVLSLQLQLTKAAIECARGAEEFVATASSDLTPEELDEHDPGGYLEERLQLLDAARDLSARVVFFQDTVATVMNNWMTMAGMTEGNASS